MILPPLGSPCNIFVAGLRKQDVVDSFFRRGETRAVLRRHALRKLPAKCLHRGPDEISDNEG
jgi:hypothetical protein